MAIRKSFKQATKQEEVKTYFNSEYGLSKKAKLSVGSEAYLILLGLENGIYETPKHTVKSRKKGGEEAGFKGKFTTSIKCKGYDTEGNKIEGAVCCQLAQDEKERIPEKADSGKRMISFASVLTHIPVMILGNSETNEKVKAIPASKLSIKTYDFSYLELPSSTLKKDIMDKYVTQLKDAGEIEYELEGEELQEVMFEKFQRTLIKVKCVPSDIPNIPYERQYTFISFDNATIGRNTNEYDAITGYTNNKSVMKDVTDFLTLFDVEVDNLVKDYTDEELVKYVKEDTQRNENIQTALKVSQEEQEEVVVTNKPVTTKEDAEIETVLTQEDISFDMDDASEFYDDDNDDGLIGEDEIPF